MKIIKQLATGNKDSIKSLPHELESLIYANVKENFPVNWNRDYITRSVFSDIKKLFHEKKIHTQGSSFTSRWKLHQLKKESDSIFSDIVIVMQITFHDGQTAKGVVFFDTSEKDSGKNVFSSLNKNSIKRQASIAHHSQLLLYDYDPITGMAFPSTAESIINSHPHSWNNWIPYTHAATVPANLALELGIKTTGLYKVSVPLSYQLCYRYLFGLGLDFNKQALETAAGINTSRGNPKFLVHISVSHGGAEPLTAFEFDSAKYVEFE